MSKVKVIFMSMILILINFNQADASSKYSNLVSAFQNYKFENEQIYQNELSRIENLYIPQIDSASLEFNNLKKDFLSQIQVRVVKQGSNRNYWGYFKCTNQRPDCIAIDKGPQFQIGEVINFIDAAPTRKDYLVEIDQIVKTGIIEVIDTLKYQSLSSSLITNIDKLDSLNKSYESAKLFAKIENDKVENTEMVINSLERVSKVSNGFEAALSTALKFEYNKKRLDEISSTSWNYINNFKSLNSAVKVAKLSALADAVGESYSQSRANSINKQCGSIFTSETNYKSYFNFVNSIVKKTTKISLKI